MTLLEPESGDDAVMQEEIFGPILPVLPFDDLSEAIRVYVEDDQPSAKPQSVAAIAKGIGVQAEPSVVSGLAQAVGDDPALRERVLPWLGIMRLDLRGRREAPKRGRSGPHSGCRVAQSGGTRRRPFVGWRHRRRYC